MRRTWRGAYEEERAKRKPDHLAAMHGCAGTGEYRPRGYGWRPGMMREHQTSWDTQCTADDAVRASEN